MTTFGQRSWPAILLGCLLALGTRESLAPVRGQADASAEKVERLIKQLGAEGFRDREAAGEALKSIGGPALGPLRKAARGNPDPEVRRRAEALVETIADKVRQAKLAKLTFRCVHYTPWTSAYNVKVAYGTYTPAGVQKESLEPLPNDVYHLTYDPGNKRYYGLGRQRVCRVDVEKRTAEKMSLGDDVPRLSWPCGIAFDTKRERVIVATLGGVGYLYAFSPKTEKWSLLADLANLDLAGLVYDEKQDCLYGLHIGPRGATFTQYNAKGAAVNEIPLVGDPLPPGLGAAPMGPPAGLAAVDGYVFIVADGGVYIVEPTSGMVRKTSKDK